MMGRISENVKKRKFDKIVDDIKNVRIQGATNIAISALRAYLLVPAKKSKKALMSLRVTEPLMFNFLKKADETPGRELLWHIKYSKRVIGKNFLKILGGRRKIIFTHCHSTTVIESMAYARKMKKNFEVYNTETRPLYQGRRTSKDLKRLGIKNTMFVDSGMHGAIEISDIVVLGADALLRKGVINKIGSAAVGEIAKVHRKPVYILADSWKFFPKSIRIEERDFREVWKKSPKTLKVRNPAFELLPKKYITKIISELGIMGYDEFLKKVAKR